MSESKGFDESSPDHHYGQGDASYHAAGQLPGIARLVDAFYRYMDTLEEARNIRAMHSADLDESRKKLSYFLSGWLGGPKRYSEHYGSINIPSAHKHLAVGQAESDAWLLCMQKAIAEQSYDEVFKEYLLAQLRVPAMRIQQRCALEPPP